MDDKAGSLDYRGFHVDFYFDDPGQQVYTVFENEMISFGSYNDHWEDDMKYIIDDKLDIITRDFGDDFFGAELKWFKNAGHEDIGLYYKMRLIKVYACANRNSVNLDSDALEKLKSDALTQLKKVRAANLLN